MDIAHTISSMVSAHAALIMGTGKVLLILIMLLLSAISLFVVISFVVWQRKLQSMERNAVRMQDEVMVICGETRAGLQALRSTMVGSASTFDPGELIHSGGRLLMLLLYRERSILAWSMLGWKIAGNAMRYFIGKR